MKPGFTTDVENFIKKRVPQSKDYGTRFLLTFYFWAS